MVLLLNYLPWIILAIGGFITYKFAVRKNLRAAIVSAIGTILAMVLLQGLTAGYIPKVRSSETKIPTPAFEPTTAEIQNHQRKPERLGAESEARFNEKTDWRKHKREEEAKAQQPTPEATQ